MSRAMKYLMSVALVCAAAGILLNPEALSEAVRSSVSGCLEVVIPSLFAFTVLAVYMQQSGLYRVALRPLTFPLSKLLGIPEELCAVFLLANIGGYPVGARLLRGLVKSSRLSRKNAGRMLCCCYGSGPSFVIGTAGMQVFGSAAVGGILFGACFLSSLIMAVIVCRTGEKITLQTAAEVGFDLSADGFVRSTDSGARVMYTVCVMATLFSAITALLDAAGITGLLARLLELAGAGENSGSIIPALLEVTRVRELLPSSAAVPLCAGILSFGGVCVLMQVTAISGGELSVKPLVLSRLPAAAISAALAAPASALIPVVAVETSSQNAAHTAAFSVNSGMSVCVLIMAGILIYSVERERR